MRMIYYFLTGFFTLLGALALVCTIERLITEDGMLPVQFLIAIIMMALAGGCLRKARDSMSDIHIGRRPHMR